MEITYEQWRLMRRDLRRRFSSIGWILLVYYLIMNVAVILSMLVELVSGMIFRAFSGDLTTILDGTEEAMNSAWGYFVAAGIGLLILLIWKKPQYWREEIWKKGKPMKPMSFLIILCFFLSGQVIYQLLSTVTELILNVFGLSMLEGLSEMAVDPNNFSMFLYAGILAPVSEEILFRGLIQRSLMPYGKKFAILCSAFTFGIFHGNLIQSPYAFLVGLVLGYVAAEYSIGWAMVLHMINNLVVADILTRLTGGLSEWAAGLIIVLITGAFGVGAIVSGIVKRKEIAAWLRQERLNRTCVQCFFSSTGIITLTVVMVLSMMVTWFAMVKPI